jgi:hypothetical protein
MATEFGASVGKSPKEYPLGSFANLKVSLESNISDNQRHRDATSHELQSTGTQVEVSHYGKRPSNFG